MFVCFSFISIICYLSYHCSGPLQNSITNYYHNARESFYYNYYGISFIYSGWDVIRLCGVCNEPGYWGTLAALLLCAEKVKLHKLADLFIFISGIFTISLAFVMILIINFICINFNSKKFQRIIIIFIAISHY